VALVSIGRTAYLSVQKPVLESCSVSAEQVALVPQCTECGEVWLPADEDRWRAYLDTDHELVFYCPECASGEFDE
jgi:hypothetical protein